MKEHTNENDLARYRLSPGRQLTEEEQSLVWRKPPSHAISEEERRICEEVKRNWNRGEMKIANILLEGDAGSGKTQLAKALSANFGLPYVKVTCFADMDKTDVIGAILPVIPPVQQEMEADEAIGGSGDREERGESDERSEVEYRFYPSEIVRAYRNGYVLEIQEPNVIRDASVLMALNSALEPDGSLNLPTEIVRRHPDFIAVITTNRGYAGTKPLNEALRDRIQHTEKMELPAKDVMIERAVAKTGYREASMLEALADAIMILDQTARAHAIKGVAGMRSYFYWADAVAGGADPKQSLYHKVIYKITTDLEEIAILEEALASRGLWDRLNAASEEVKKKRNTDDAITLRTEGELDEGPEEAADADRADDREEKSGIVLKKAADSEPSASRAADDSTFSERSDFEGDGSPQFREAKSESLTAEAMQRERDFRRKLNREAREIAAGSVHAGVKLIVHRSDFEAEHESEYKRISRGLLPIVRETARKTLPLLEHEASSEFARYRYDGGRFLADSVAYRDFRYFAKKRPPADAPSLAVGLRVDESASMSAFGRLEAAKRAVIAVYEYCLHCRIPVMIYGDTADVSRLERMSIYAYADLHRVDPGDRYRLMGIRPRSNNRDGMALRIMAERLAAAPQKTKLLISISDGQPKAMDDYTGEYAVRDMQTTISEYERKGVAFLAAAIGHDKDVIHRIYGDRRYLDITDLNEFPARLVRTIARHL